jgi:hypothetical protein
VRDLLNNAMRHTIRQAELGHCVLVADRSVLVPALLDREFAEGDASRYSSRPYCRRTRSPSYVTPVVDERITHLVRDHPGAAQRVEHGRGVQTVY